jgi:3',5'-nucleoside bisphosphate phosphatase
VIDLHVHSTFSDGSLTPEELVEKAAKVGLTAMALTDHDGMMGIDRFLAACKSHGLHGIPGVEISVDFSGGTMHMLGYFMDHLHSGIDDSLVKLRQGREERNQLILEKLNRLGFGMSWEEVSCLAKEDVVGM